MRKFQSRFYEGSERDNCNLISYKKPILYLTLYCNILQEAKKNVLGNNIVLDLITYNELNTLTSFIRPYDSLC